MIIKSRWLLGAGTLAIALAALVGPTKVEAQLSSVYVGDVGFNDRWKCQSHANGTTYIATDTTETKARRKLLDYGLTQIFCRHSSRF